MSLFVSPAFRASDANGVLPGATWTFYTTGTTTPASIYTTSARNVAHPNPVVADAAGLFPPIYLDPSVTYRAILKNAVGTTIQDIDPVNSDSAADFRFTPAGTGTTRTIEAKLRDVVSVKDFGAKGDNSTDDTSAIQTAINYCIASGDTLVIPGGTYRYTSLSISGTVQIDARRSARLVKTTTTGNGISIIGSGARIYMVSLQGMILSSLSTSTSGALLYIENVGQTNLDLRVDNIPASAFRGIELYNVSQISIGGSVQNCVDRGLYARDCLDVTLRPGFRSDANLHGVEFDTCSGVTGFGSAYGNTGNGVRITNNIVSPILANGNLFHFWTSFVSDSSASHNWYITSLAQSVLTTCWGATQSGTADAHGFYVTGSQLEMVGCIGINNNGCGLVATGTSTIMVTGGQLNGNGKNASASFRAGAYCDNGSTLSIANAEMMDRQATKTQQRGLYAETAAKLTINGCDLTNNVVAPYTFAGAPATFFESNNTTGESNVLASASTVTLPWFGKNFIISGTTNIGTLGNMYKGRQITLNFQGALTVTSGFGLKVNGNFVTTADDIIGFLSPDGVAVVETFRSANA